MWGRDLFIEINSTWCFSGWFCLILEVRKWRVTRILPFCKPLGNVCKKRSTPLHLVLFFEVLMANWVWSLKQSLITWWFSYSVLLGIIKVTLAVPRVFQGCSWWYLGDAWCHILNWDQVHKRLHLNLCILYLNLL